MTKITLPKNLVLDILMEDTDEGSIIEDKIIGHSRWAVQHEIIFEYQNKYHKTYYEKGATEYQDVGIWEDQDEIECFEVYQVPEIVMIWKEV
jgi:hypothetical protein